MTNIERLLTTAIVYFLRQDEIKGLNFEIQINVFEIKHIK
jgi:hypothetical protein